MGKLKASNEYFFLKPLVGCKLTVEYQKSGLKSSTGCLGARLCLLFQGHSNKITTVLKLLFRYYHRRAQVCNKIHTKPEKQPLYSQYRKLALKRKKVPCLSLEIRIGYLCPEKFGLYSLGYRHKVWNFLNL